MAVHLLFSNLAPSAKKGELIAVMDINHPISPKMSMLKHIEAGGTAQNWPRVFSSVIITDRDKHELLYLIDDVRFDAVTGDYVKKYKFTHPAYGTARWNSLYETGEVHISFDEFSAYVELT